MADNNVEAIESIDSMIAKLQSVSTELPETLAEKAVPIFQGVMEDQINAGTAPDGTPWQKTAKGETPLQNAVKAMSITSVGNTVLARLDGHNARHHHGTAKGGIKRQILPTRELPQSAIKALEKLTEAELKKHLEA